MDKFINNFQPTELRIPINAFEDLLKFHSNKAVGKISPKLFCKECSKEITKQSKSGLCNSCSKKGKLNYNFKGNEAVHRQIYYCIMGCGTKITSQTYLYGKGMCIECANKKTNIKRISYSGKNNPAFKDGRSLGKYHCIDCGKKIGWQTWYKGSKRCGSCSCKERLSDPRNHPNYLNGLNLVPYNSEFNNDLKETIRKRDNYTCQNCNMTEEEHLIVIGTNLHCHHIDYNKKNSKPENLITLCNSCHIRSNYNRNYWKEYYKNKMEVGYGIYNER
jgi:hypothetical protein